MTEHERIIIQLCDRVQIIQEYCLSSKVIDLQFIITSLDYDDIIRDNPIKNKLTNHKKFKSHIVK